MTSSAHKSDWIGGASRVAAVLVGLTALCVTAERAHAAEAAPASEPLWSPTVTAPGPVAEAEPVPPAPSEGVEADVSTRRVSITSSFTGVEIVVFGAITNAQPDVAEAGLYDIAIVVEGAPGRVTARRKTNQGGIWINTKAVVFEGVPSYYAIASTKPLDEMANPVILRQNDIGFERIAMQPVSGWKTGVTSGDLQDFKTAVIRLKGRDRLFVSEPYGVDFVGTNLFRTTIDLPANVPVGPLDARIHLFRDGNLIDTFRTRVMLERQGLERYLHAFAFDYPLFYGIFTVMVALLAGLLASAIVKKIRG